MAPVYHDVTASSGAPWVCSTIAREEKQMTYDTDDLTIDDLDDKVFDAAKALFAAIQFSATVQDNRQLTKAEIIAAAIEWFEGIASDLSDADFHQF